MTDDVVGADAGRKAHLLTWIDRLTGADRMPVPMLQEVRREQLARALDIVPVVALGQLATGLLLLHVTARDPMPTSSLVWAWALVAMSLLTFVSARALKDSRFDRKVIYGNPGIHAIVGGFVWGFAPLALAPSDEWTTATVLLGSGGVLLVSSLMLTMLPSLSIMLSAVGGIAFFVSTLVLVPLEHALSLGLLSSAFFATLPPFILHGARGMMRRQQEGFLTRERHATARYLLENHEVQGSDMLWECDGEFRMVRPSRRLCRLAGLAPEQAQGMATVSFLAASGVQPAGLTAFLAAVRGRNTIEDVRLEVRAPDCEPIWWSISGRPRFDRDGEFAGFVGIGRDVTSEHLASRELVRMAETDRLTGLANRHFFRSVLTAAVDRQAEPETGSSGPGGDRRFAVMVLDLERFRSINATFGHATGDRLLVEASLRILSCLEGRPKGSTCLARLAGDEFALMLDGTGKAGAARIAAAVAEELARPFTLNERVVRSSARIGIALSPASEGGSDATDMGSTEDGDMLQRAELALACVKAAGRGAWRFFDPDMALDHNARAALERDLAEHLNDPDAHFELLYQPLVVPADGSPRGMEALIRWNHPREGTISPGLFIPMAERLGYIERIGRWSLETACREATRWGRPGGRPGSAPGAPRVAVNISAPHFAGGNLLDHVRGALDLTGLEPGRLEIEVTESVLVDDVGEAERTLRGLHALGAQVALDDFGTGYSSLGYLQRFPFDKLKIDRRFIVTGEQDDRSQRILAMIVELGRTLDMTVVAEGIETPAQARMASRLGCDLLQGYLFARPLAVADARALIDASAAVEGPDVGDAAADPLAPKLKVVAA